MDSVELPSINSSTSISDNPELKNYYDKLLFKNSSGKSITDFQEKVHESKNNNNNDDNNSNNQFRVDFIKGFNSTNKPSPLANNEPFSPSTKSPSPNEVGDVKRRSSKVTFSSFQMTPNDSDHSSEDGNDLSMFQTTRTSVQHENDTIINNNVHPSGRRQSIFNFTENGNVKPSTTANSTTVSPNAGQNVPMFNAFNFNGTPTTNDNNNDNGTNATLNSTNTINTNSNPNDFQPPMTSAGNLSLADRQAIFASERRSSYISDSLIHHNYENPNMSNYQGYVVTNPNTNNNINGYNTDVPAYNGNINNDMGYNNNYPITNDPNRRLSQTVQMQSPATLLSQMFNTTNHIKTNNDNKQPQASTGYPYNRLSASAASGNVVNQNNTYGGMMYNNHYLNGNEPTSFDNNGNNNNNYNGQRRNTQPALLPMDINRNIQNFNMSSNKNQYGYLNYLNTPRYNNNNGNNNNFMNNNNNNTNNATSNNNSDNGLILLNTKQLTSSADLQDIYEDCGKKYFSSEKVYEFTDYVKKLLNPDENNDKDDTSFVKTKKSILKFLSFLKSCNLNYNPQSDAFVSRDNSTNSINSTGSNGNNSNNNNRRSSVASNNNINNNNNQATASSTSAYLHYKPLVLVSLKNGKLELLSIPQNSNLLMKRGDLIIIDGDRGKDLALVVEPTINLDMALIINFFKKKIHFDSLITNKNQHYPNNKFVDALINSTKGLTDELNPKLYDVIELIQLVVPSKQVLRFATPWEVSTNLHNKFQDELKALHIAQLKLKSLNNHDSSPSNSNINMGLTNNNNNNNSNNTNSSRLNIKILNAEFQFDRKKLTFYYICEERNDFRELIKELFKFYKTRIWLCAIPNNLNVDKLYYNNQQYELAMYQDMMSHYINDDLNDSNFQNSGNGGFIVAPALNKLKLDDFQIGVYKELVKALFS